MISFSIVSVCYNSAASIRRTMESVASQRFENYEHIIIDGASTDQTLEIVRECANARTRIFSEPDDGIYDAMNKGVRAAKGDVICFLNSDDVYSGPDVLSRVAGLLAGENIDAVFGDVTFHPPAAPHKVVRRYDSSQFSPQKIGGGWMPAHPAMFVRRTVYDRVGPFKTDYAIAGDFEWVARAFSTGSIRYTHTPEVFVRMQMGGVSTRGIRSTINLNREILRACRENGIPSSPARLMRKFPRKIAELFIK